jgi:hypothetical protein
MIERSIQRSIQPAFSLEEIERDLAFARAACAAEDGGGGGGGGCSSSSSGGGGGGGSCT